MRSTRARSRQLKRPLSLKVEETVILLIERSVAHLLYIARSESIRQTTLGGVEDKRLNSVRTESDRKKESNRERKVAARKLSHTRACNGTREAQQRIMSSAIVITLATAAAAIAAAAAAAVVVTNTVSHFVKA